VAKKNGAIFNYKKGGQAFLVLVILIGGIISFIGILLAFVANSFVDTGYGQSDSVAAEAAAASGAQDGLLQVDRNPSFSNTSGYTVTTGSSTAKVTVTQSSPSAGFITILSVSTVLGHTKKVDVVLGENTSTTQLNVVSWQEVQ
jgi:hypothetical protein